MIVLSPRWVIFELRSDRTPFGRGEITPAATPTPSQGHNIFQPPTLKSAEEVEAFIADVREAADRVFGAGKPQEGGKIPPACA